MIRTKLQRLIFEANECGSFLYSAMHGLSDGRAGCDGKTLYLEGGLSDWEQTTDQFPVPFFVNITELGRGDKKKIQEGLPRILDEHGKRVGRYLETVQPIFHLSTDSKKNYLITEKRVVPITPGIKTKSLTPYDSDPAWFDDKTRAEIDVDMFRAVSTANHQQFFREFCPWYFEMNPKTGHLTPDKVKLVRKYAEMIADESPENSRDLLELLHNQARRK